VEEETRAKAKEQAATALREAAAKVAPKLDEMIDEFAKNLDRWVVAAGKELHREMIDVLQRARTELGQAAPDADRTTTECDALNDALGKTQRQLESLRASLWGTEAAERTEDCPGADGAVR
jgi:ABC-type transporter Mla subunit MlaD